MEWTDRHGQITRAERAWVAEHGEPPTMRQLAARLHEIDMGVHHSCQQQSARAVSASCLIRPHSADITMPSKN